MEQELYKIATYFCYFMIMQYCVIFPPLISWRSLFIALATGTLVSIQRGLT